MTMDGRLLVVGVIGCVVGFVMFMSGVMTDHWAKTDKGDHWGLWNYCINSSFHAHHSFINASRDRNGGRFGSPVRATFSEAGRPTPRPSTPSPEHHSNINSTDEEEETCDILGLTNLPVTLHIVRTLVAVGIISIVYSGLSAKGMRHRFGRKESFLSTHRVEVGCLFGGALGIAAVSLFKSSYKSHQFDFSDGEDHELDWSVNSVKSGCIIILIGSLFLMAPMLKEKIFGASQRSGSSRCFLVVFIEDFFKDPYSFCCDCFRKSEARVPEEEPRVVPEAVELEIGLQRTDSFSSSINSIPDSVSQIFVVAVGDYSPSLSRSSRQNYDDPAPRYEDLAPREPEDIPPPPSYDEALSGQYFVSHGSNSDHNAPSLMLPTNNNEPAPPSYDESTT